MNARPVELPGTTTITATKVTAPPAWALMERQLFSLMEESARTYTSKYAERGGATLLAEDLDDLYEQFYNFGIFYALGGADDMLDLHLQQWNATNRISDQSFNHRPIHNNHTKKFTPAQHNEFWGMNHAMEWHHLGEGLMSWYDMGVADPTISENARRSRRFAGMYIGEDPEADLWDASKRIIRSPFQSSQGPMLEGDVNWANTMLLAGRYLGGEVNYYGVRASLYPIVPHLEARWFENPQRRAYIVDLFNKLVLQRDTPNTLAATALVTDAYLYTGDEKYKQWVLDYLEAWIDRTKRNGGITPDNVDHDGVIGGGREGVFWGGQYGWNHYQGYNIMFHGINTAVECALMLTGDYEYLELLRSQLKVIVDAAKIEDDGQLITPVRYGPEGWILTPPVGRGMNDGISSRGVMQGPSPMRAQEMMHLYHASHGPAGLRVHHPHPRSGRPARLERDRRPSRREELRRDRVRPLPVLRRQEPRLADQDTLGGVQRGHNEVRGDDGGRQVVVRHHNHEPDAAAPRPHEGADPGNDGHTAGDL